jgi:hypothetical protein
MSNRSIFVFAALLVLIIIGMLAGSFRLIIYPYMLIIGLLLLIGLAKKIKVNKKIVWVPTIITLLFLLLQGWLDNATLQTPTGGVKLIFGFTVTNAIYYLGIWTLCACFSLIYAWVFNQREGTEAAVNSNTLDV